MKAAKIFSVILTLAAVSCTGKFEDYNTNPFGPTPEDMKGDNVETGMLVGNMIPALIQGQQNNSQMIDQMIGMEFGGHASMINPWNASAGSGNYYTYNPREGWYGNTFDITMPQIYTNLFQIREKTEGRGLVFAWAQLIRVAATLKVSDCYGPVPYSKVDGDAYSVEYDTMPELYNAMFADLDDAIAVISSAVSGGADASSLKQFDYIYGADFSRWLKYACTLKLRMAMRIVNADPALAKTKAEEAVAAGVMTDASDAARSSFNDGMNPLYRAAYTWNGGEFRVSANITSYLGGYSDPRLKAYATESANGYVGVRNGISHTASTFAAYQALSNINIGETDELLLMSASEAWFLRAEGALRGWTMGGSAKDLYEAGVETSMKEKGVSIGNYLASTATPADYVDPVKSAYNISAVSSITPAWDDAADMQTNLERIMVQKWIASYPNGWECWADIRRTGYPKFFPVVSNLSGGTVKTDLGMQRLPYPQSEYNTNGENVAAAVKSLGGADNAGTALWWSKNK